MHRATSGTLAAGSNCPLLHDADDGGRITRPGRRPIRSGGRPALKRARDIPEFVRPMARTGIERSPGREGPSK